MKHKYEIAFSYASEQKALVKKLSDKLIKLGVSVFADYLEPERFWGSFLPEELRKVYYEESKIILIFLSREYRDKAYTSFEGRIAAEKSLKNEHFLIIKTDDVDLSWLNTAQGFIKWADYSVEQIANMLMKKLGKTVDNQTNSLFQIIQRRAVTTIEQINLFLNYTLLHYADKNSFSIELLNNDKISMRFSLIVKERTNSLFYQLFLVKYPLYKDSELYNGEFCITHDNEFVLYNYGFFRSIFSPTITYQNQEELVDAIASELIKCGESFYD